MKKLKILLTHLLLLLVLTTQAQITANWQSIGPKKFPKPEGGLNVAYGIGRISQLGFHPTDANTMFAISAGGGVFKTTDNGVNWQNLNTDGLTRGASAICINRTNPATILIGLGDENYAGTGLGMWRSDNGGQNWQISNTGMAANECVFRIVQDPQQATRFIAAGGTGLYLSVDNGQSWTLKMSGRFQDLIYNTNNISGVVFAIKDNGAFYRSADQGGTWSVIPSAVVPGGVTNSGSRIAVSKANANIVYIGYTSQNGVVMKSTDGGLNFSYVKNATLPNLPAYDNSLTSNVGQGNYNFDITADPADANKIWLVSHQVWRSDNGGIDWIRLRPWQQLLSTNLSDTGIHTDHHNIIIHPLRANDLLDANDGGVYRSSDGGANWQPISDGIRASEIYHAAGSLNNGNNITIGLQDNGRLYTTDKQIFTADGMSDIRHFIKADYNNYTYYFNDFYNTVSRIDRITNKPAGTLNYPFTVNSNGYEPHEIAFNRINIDLAFAAKNTGIFRTTNLASQTTVSWTMLANFSTTIKAIGLAPDKTNILYYVTGNNKFCRSTTADAATVSIDSSATLPAVTTGLSARIAVMPNSNGAILYLTIGSRVFRSANSGSSWAEISTGLTTLGISEIYADDFKSDESIYAMGIFGVYYKNSSMASWTNYSQGMTITAPYKEYMIFNDGSSNARLRIATYGRGLWETPLVSLTNPAPVVSITSPLNNSTFPAPASVTINANATVSSGTISKVDFYQGATLLGTDVTAPYSYSWTNVAAGTYTLTAKATSNTNATTTSSVVNITVNAASVCNNSLEPNGTLATAIVTTGTLKSQIASATDLDWFKFTPTVSGSVTINLTTLPADYDLYLYQSNGVVIDSSYTDGLIDESITANLVAGTAYYIRINGYLGAFNTTGCYTLTITGGGAALIATKPVLSQSAIVTAKSEETNAADNLSIKVSPNPSSGNFILSISSKTNESVQIRILDINGRLMKVIRSAAETPVQFGQGMKAGTYLVEVKQGTKTKIVKVIKL